MRGSFSSLVLYNRETVNAILEYSVREGSCKSIEGGQLALLVALGSSTTEGAYQVACSNPQAVYLIQKYGQRTADGLLLMRQWINVYGEVEVGAATKNVKIDGLVEPQFIERQQSARRCLVTENVTGVWAIG